MITWQFWTLIGALLVLGFDVSSGLDRVADHLGFMSVTLNDLLKSRREEVNELPLASPLMPDPRAGRGQDGHDMQASADSAVP
jgi:hypothetical protein